MLLIFRVSRCFRPPPSLVITPRSERTCARGPYSHLRSDGVLLRQDGVCVERAVGFLNHHVISCVACILVESLNDVIFLFRSPHTYQKHTMTLERTRMAKYTRKTKTMIRIRTLHFGMNLEVDSLRFEDVSDSSPHTTPETPRA